MKCIICNNNTNLYFTKTYEKQPVCGFMEGVGPVEYHKCAYCGFVISRTHTMLRPEQWKKLNADWHHFFESQDNLTGINQPPYMEQAIMIKLLAHHGVISTSNWIDYAGGYGSLSSILRKYLSIDLPIYDLYVQNPDLEYVDVNNDSTYSTVINSAMFEHVLSRQDLDDLNKRVAQGGCMILHTLVCERVPDNSNWFYLDPPVHTAFHTNKSMQLLMDQWGYTCSIYCLRSKCWVLFKKKPYKIEQKLSEINQELQSEWFIFKHGFVDYWKGFKS